MCYFIALIICLLPSFLFAEEWEDQKQFNQFASGATIRVLSSTDTAIFAPVIQDFVLKNPEVAVEYFVTGTTAIEQLFRSNPKAFDLVISSAMDLQLKIVNDGLALQLENVRHPAWAQWRQSLFAFTSEPAAIVINRDAFAGYPVPQTRQDLIQAMRTRPSVFRGRVGTYDIRKSGLGYLFATQDARASETYWRLMEVMGSLDVRLYCCSGEMIDDLADGTIAVAYNVLGSYASARHENKDVLDIILPSDFPTTMMRTAMVSKLTNQPELASDFIQHLINLQSHSNKDILMLSPLNTQSDYGDRTTIALEPALMTFLDTLKRRKFLAEWENAVIQ
ncbi:MAG: ABC transporter substrate-binding protein [Tateyamaria sp.]|nr:ABC transporter substrate-binding protein [Tateyamaria sp.]